MPFTFQLNISFRSIGFFFWINICHCLLSAVIKVIWCSLQRHRWWAVRGCCWWVTNSFGEGADSHCTDINYHQLLDPPRMERQLGHTITLLLGCSNSFASAGDIDAGAGNATWLTKVTLTLRAIFPQPQPPSLSTESRKALFFLVQRSCDLPAPSCRSPTLTTSSNTTHLPLPRLLIPWL